MRNLSRDNLFVGAMCSSVAALILVFLCSIIYSQFFSITPNGINPQGDFRAHASFVNVNYSFIYWLRDAVAWGLGVSKYSALFVVIEFAVVTNFLLALVIFFRISKSAVSAVFFSSIFVCFMPVFNLIDGGIYNGQISANIWHNSTYLISVAPNICLFLFAAKSLREKPSSRNVLITTILSVLSFTAKPSFFPVFAVSIFLFSLISKSVNTLNVVKLGAISCALFFVFYMLFLPSDLGMEFAPGYVWNLSSTNIPYSIFTSVIFFLAMGIIYPSYLKRIEILIGLTCLIVGISQFFFLAELGSRLEHGNLSWGMHQAASVLLMASLIFLIQQPKNKKFFLALACIAPHVFSGIAYMLNKGIIPLLKYQEAPIFGISTSLWGV